MLSAVWPMKSHPENWRQHSTSRQYAGDQGSAVVCYLEDPDRFNAEVRVFLHAQS